MIGLSHLFPALSWFNVWDLPWPVYLAYVHALEQHNKQIEEANRG